MWTNTYQSTMSKKSANPNPNPNPNPNQHQFTTLGTGGQYAVCLSVCPRVVNPSTGLGGVGEAPFFVSVLVC